MRCSSRSLLFLLVTAVLAALLLLPLAALQRPVAAATPPPAVSGGARIDEPRAQSSVRGIVKVMGTASTPDFKMYQMYIQRPGSTAFEWKFERNTPVVNGSLWEWSTNQRDYPDGSYVIRMWVVKLDGNYDEVTVAVRVDNSSTQTPSPTATRASSPTPAVTPTAITVATPQVIGMAPTLTPAPTRPAATPTPMFGIDVGKLIDPMPWVRAFTTGMVLALGGIGFIIALFIARALLRWRP
jgi:hypothetical protein